MQAAAAAAPSVGGEAEVRDAHVGSLVCGEGCHPIHALTHTDEQLKLPPQPAPSPTLLMRHS